MSLELTSPHTIYDYQGLKEIANDVYADYEIGCDIDCTESIADNSGNGWKPFNFYGKLEGNGYCLSNLYSKMGGLFGHIYGSVGGLGFRNGRLEDVSDTGMLSNSIDTNGTIERCYVENCILLPKIQEGQTYPLGANNIAGLANYLRKGTIKECYTANCVIGQEKKNYNQIVKGAAGFISHTLLYGTIQDCYTRGCRIYALESAGGFICEDDYFLYTDPQTTGIKRCYSANMVALRSSKSNTLRGGFCAKATSKAIERQEGNFYDSTVFGVASGYGYGYAKITEQMKDIKTFEAQDWQFTIVNDDGTVIKNTWRIEDGLTYPYLQFNKQYKELVPNAFLKIKNEEGGDKYALLVDPFNVNLDVVPHLYIRES